MGKSNAVVGVLALQGDFREHLELLRSMKAEAREVRTISDLRECSALIIPGGESTTISNLLDSSGLGAEIKKRAGRGMAIYGTCAGAIIIARKVLREKMFRPLNLIDIEVERNAFGRQVDSFEAEIEVKGLGKLNGVFIRAPVIKKAGKKAEVLASFNGKPVLVRQGNILAGTFHPEAEHSTKIHEFFLEMI